MKYIILLSTFSCQFLAAQTLLDDYDKIRLGSKFVLEYKSESYNDWMRAYMASTIQWNTSTKLWDVGAGSLTDFSMIQLSNGGDINFYNRANSGSYYSLTNSELYNYRRMTIESDGDVGIGTQNADGKLHVMDDANNELRWSLIVNNPYNSSTNNEYGVGIKLKHSGNHEQWKWSGIASVNEGGWANTSGLVLYSNETEKMRIKANGNVGIGTTAPDAKLTVNGNIHAEEVKVDLNVPAPDYVFKEGYDLKSLEEVQNYIAKHGHLPNVPSAQEMEENGIQLGEMNMKLLEKIEELTLYILALKEENKRLLDQEHRIKEIEMKLQGLTQNKNH